MEVNKFADDILDRHKLYLEIHKTIEDDIIILELNYQDTEREAYLITYGEDLKYAVIHYFSYRDIIDEKQTGELFYLPTFAHRLYIFFQFLRRIEQKKIPYAAIRFFDESGERVENLNCLITLPDSEEDTEKEIQLDNVMASILKDKRLVDKWDDELKKLGLYHTFYLMKGLIV